MKLNVNKRGLRGGEGAGHMVWSAITWICSNKGVIEKGRRSCESWLDKAAKTLFFQANEAVVWRCAAECRGWRSMEEAERPWTWFVIQSESLGGPQRRETSSPYVCFVCIWKLQGWRLGDEEEEGHTALCIIRFEGMCGSCCCVFFFFVSLSCRDSSFSLGEKKLQQYQEKS